ncbi:DUF402 domain-containing protein [Dermacoccus sp. Tok2021]|uniref:DUF402 domain-containing protein n=1 Tax=Dermacoccus sp. Tok2021 TaxID=2826873 RepID=UPI001CA733ED|nr:DUF402 domain-containing protein [Dermacoccus sp. Tok2021]
MAREKTRLQFGKYNGDEHWGSELEILGQDANGLWLGGRKGTEVSKPGTSQKVPCNHVVLIPDEQWWVATFNAEPAGRSRTIEVYVDITTPTTVNQGEAFTLDLDVDVIKRTTGVVEIDDEDEFEAHTRDFAYPARLVTAAREAADAVRSMIENGEAPFDGSHRAWLAKI